MGLYEAVWVVWGLYGFYEAVWAIGDIMGLDEVLWGCVGCRTLYGTVGVCRGLYEQCGQ